MLGEAFTVLAVLEATDRISSVIEKVDAALDGFSESSQRAADVAAQTGAAIDDSLLQTASGADAAELADARLATAREKLTAATAQQAAAEQALLDARASVASETDLAAAADAVAAAQQRAADAATGLKDAQVALKAAKSAKVSEDELQVATDAVTAAQERATAATNELTDARARQAALVTPDDVAQSADAVTAAERRTAAATDEASAAQERQSAIQGLLTGETAKAAAAADAEAAAQARLAAQQKLAADASASMSKAMQYGALGVAAIGYESVKAAGNFQSLTAHLVTDAGESQANLAKVQAGILSIATATGTSTTDLVNGMYHIESAGYHGAAGLQVLKTAAEGAKVGGADLDTVSKTLVGTLNAYGQSSSSATSFMNQLIATVGAGDMRMEDLASSLSNVTAVAASAGISFAQVGGAIATMTAQNMTAQNATQDLGSAIMSLQNPNSVQQAQLQAIGLTSAGLAKTMGTQGLTGTFAQLTAAVLAHTKGDQVLVSAFQSSQQAAADANTMIKAMPASLQKLAQAYIAGGVTQQQWATDLKGLPPIQAKLMAQFASTADKTDAFNAALAKGGPAAQTVTQTMAKLTGTSAGLKTALMLTGAHAITFDDNVKTIAASASAAGSSVANWSTIQGTFNQKMDRLKSSVEAVGVSIGSTLLPMVSKVASVLVDVLGPTASWIAQHQKWVGLALAVAGGIGAIVLAMKAWEVVQGVMNALTAIFAAEETAILSPIELVIIAIAALVAGVIYAYTHFKTFHDIVQDVFHAVEAAGEALWHALEAVFRGLVKVWDVVADAAKDLWHALETAWDAVSGAAKSVWNTIAGAWHQVESVTSSVWNRITAFFKKWWPLLLAIFMPPVALIWGLWHKFGTDIENDAKSVWNAIAGFLQTVWNGIKDIASTVWGLVKTTIVQPVEQVWDFIKQTFDTVSQWLASKWGFIKAVAQQVWNEIHSTIIAPVEAVWNDITTWFGKIYDTVKSKIDDAWNAVESVAAKFYDVGKDIVNGIVKGVEDAGGALLKSVKNIASNALNGVKSFLGIGSPSKVFAAEVGQWIPHGVAKGVADYTHVAQQAVTTMAASLTASARTGVTGGVTLAGGGLAALPASAAGAGGVNVVVDLRGATAMSDSDFTKLANKVGSTVTAQLAAAGVRIRG